MLDPTYALAASLIWAFSPIYYKSFLKRIDFLSLNLARTSLAAAVLAAPSLYYGFGSGTAYAILSGAITLAVGDSLFLLSIAEMGASVATPVVYTYVLLVQVTANAVGEAVPVANVVAALMILLGIYFLSQGGNGRPRARGIAMALSAAVVWTAGQDLIRLATVAGGSAVNIAFCRNIAAAFALGVAALATGRLRRWPVVSKRECSFLVLVCISDLALGSLLYVYSVSLVGIAATVIFTSLSPFLTQVFSTLLGKESPSRSDFAGGALIVAALVLAVLL